MKCASDSYVLHDFPNTAQTNDMIMKVSVFDQSMAHCTRLPTLLGNLLPIFLNTAVLHLLRGESTAALSNELGVEINRLEKSEQRTLARTDASSRARNTTPERVENKLRTKTMTSLINIREGYKQLTIASPMEVAEDDE